MKKIVLFVSLALAMLSTSCVTVKQRSITSATVVTPRVGLCADLDVSPTKILFTYTPGSAFKKVSREEVLNNAIWLALSENGNADVMVGLESQIIYNELHEIVLVKITGYPAKYKNIRNVGE